MNFVALANISIRSAVEVVLLLCLFAVVC